MPHPDVKGGLARAEALCAARGARLTPTRRRVLELILEAEQPIGAYALLDALREGRRRLGPPSVYRALDFLLANRLIHRIETATAFVACADVEHPHHSQFVICEDCGTAEEIRDEAIVDSLRRLGERRGFAVRHEVIEARGLCPSCRAAQRAS